MIITGRNFLYVFESYNGKGTTLYAIKFWDRETAQPSGYQVGIRQNGTGDVHQPKEFVDTAPKALNQLVAYRDELHRYGVEVDISKASVESFEAAELPPPAPAKTTARRGWR